MEEKKIIGVRAISKLTKMFLVSMGTLSIGVGFLGIFLPLLPTTPFLLLAAGCYARGSDSFYNWLMKHKEFGSYIRNYREKRGISLRAKVCSLILLWLTISYSAIFVVPIIFVKIMLFVVAIGVTIHLLSLNTL